MSLPTLRSLAHFMLAMTVALCLATQGIRAMGLAAKASKHTEATATDMAMVGTTATPMCDKCDRCKNGRCKGDRASSLTQRVGFVPLKRTASRLAGRAQTPASRA